MIFHGVIYFKLISLDTWPIENSVYSAVDVIFGLVVINSFDYLELIIDFLMCHHKES